MNKCTKHKEDGKTFKTSNWKKNQYGKKYVRGTWKCGHNLLEIEIKD